MHSKKCKKQIKTVTFMSHDIVPPPRLYSQKSVWRTESDVRTYEVHTEIYEDLHCAFISHISFSHRNLRHELTFIFVF